LLSARFFWLQISRRRWHRSAWNFAWWSLCVPDVFYHFGGGAPGSPNPKFMHPRMAGIVFC